MSSSGDVASPMTFTVVPTSTSASAIERSVGEPSLTTYANVIPSSQMPGSS